MEHPTKYYSNAQESMIADFLGWKKVAASGARDFHKGDVKGDQWLGECKTHTEPGHKLQFDYEVWKKISDEAYGHFKKPVLFTDDGSQKLENIWCMVELPRPELFPEVQLTWNRAISLYTTLQQLKSLYITSPYTFLVVTRGKEKFAIMPLEEFKEYIERVK